jgi:hypothetical protein
MDTLCSWLVRSVSFGLLDSPSIPYDVDIIPTTATTDRIAMTKGLSALGHFLLPSSCLSPHTNTLLLWGSRVVNGNDLLRGLASI